MSWWLGINFLLLIIFQSSLIDLKEHASSLASAGLKRDSKLKSLEIAIEQKKEECSKLEAQLKKVSSILKQTNNQQNKNQHPIPSFWNDELIYSSGVNLQSTHLILFADACIKYCFFSRGLYQSDEWASEIVLTTSVREFWEAATNRWTESRTLEGKGQKEIIKAAIYMYVN